MEREREEGEGHSEHRESASPLSGLAQVNSVSTPAGQVHAVEIPEDISRENREQLQQLSDLLLSGAIIQSEYDELATFLLEQPEEMSPLALTAEQEEALNRLYRTGVYGIQIRCPACGATNNTANGIHCDECGSPLVVSDDSATTADRTHYGYRQQRSMSTLTAPIGSFSTERGRVVIHDGFFEAQMHRTQVLQDENYTEYTVYVLRCQWQPKDSSESPYTWLVSHRFSVFEWLHKDLKRKIPSAVATLPTFPSKHVLGGWFKGKTGNSSAVVEERKQSLERYVAQVLELCAFLPDTLTVPELDRFLNVSRQVEQFRRQVLSEETPTGFGRPLNVNDGGVEGMAAREQARLPTELPTPLNEEELSHIEQAVAKLDASIQNVHGDLRRDPTVQHHLKVCVQLLPRLQISANWDNMFANLDLIPRAIQCQEDLETTLGLYNNSLLQLAQDTTSYQTPLRVPNTIPDQNNQTMMLQDESDPEDDAKDDVETRLPDQVGEKQFVAEQPELDTERSNTVVDTNLQADLALEMLCSRVGEAEPLYRHVLERLQQPATEHGHSMEKIRQRLQILLELNQGKAVAVRLVSAHSVANSLADLHKEIDHLEPDACKGQWQMRWKTDRAEMKRNLFEGDISQMVNDLDDSGAPLEALTLLIHELKRNKTSYTDQELRFLHVVVGKIVGFSKLSVPAEEAWLIARHDVHLAKESFCRGAFGKIYRGTYLNASAVIKCVKMKTNDDRNTFLREVRVWYEASRHPNIVPFFGACHVGSPCFMACKFISGGSLPEYLYKQRAMDERTSNDVLASEAARVRAWKALLDVTHGLQFLHSKGIVHGDLKGNNILVEGNTAMITDFGMSFFISEPRPNYKNVGAIRWRSPEFLTNGPSFEADIYSLGMCIVEAVTGKFPWWRLDDIAIKYHLKQGTFLQQPQEMLDEEWALVRGMCAFDPTQRMNLVDIEKQIKAFVDEEDGTQHAYATSEDSLLGSLSRSLWSDEAFT